MRGIGMAGGKGLAIPALMAALLVLAGATGLSAGEKPKEGANLQPVAKGMGTQIAHLTPQNQDFEIYLDRLMMAESSGRDFLKNSRSSALGPFQFIKGTFLYVTRRHFKADTKGMSEAQVLALRTNRTFSRKVIAVYTQELARHLKRHGLPTTYGNLRLAYLLGPSGATRVLKAKPTLPVRQLISRAAVAANPFLAAMTAQDLIDRAVRDISMDRSKRLHVAASKPGKASSNQPRIKVRCNLSRPSCRRWLALRKAKLRKQKRYSQAKARNRKSR